MKIKDKNLNIIAYPNTDQYMYSVQKHDTKKWLETVKSIYSKEKNGLDRIEAVRQSTNGWNVVEVFDFLNWFKFYEEGAHLKYKTAQLWYENGEPGYFLHVKNDPVIDSNKEVAGKDIDAAREDISNQMTASQKKQIIEKQRSKIIGRLDSAEKLLRSEDGQLFAGKELESLMESIYNLKKKLQLVNKISTATKLYDDMIIREANILVNKGFVKAANVLYSVAQESIPTATPPASPIENSGSPGGLPSMGPGMPQNPPDSAPNENSPTDFSNGIKEFLDRTETAGLTKDDELEVQDFEEELVVEAQVAKPDMTNESITTNTSPAPKNPTAPFKPVKNDLKENNQDDSLEVTEDDIEPKSEDNSMESKFDVKLDQLMAGVTITDIVYELEGLSKIFKTREIPRRLSRADMMLDSLGLAAYFPSLSEAQNKSLEANNYIATRVDDILSKLRGSMNAKEIDLEGQENVEKPEISGIKNKLKSDDEKEKARKQMRKDQEAAELDNKNENKETPEIEIEEDLGEPTPSKAAPPAAPITTKPTPTIS